ncbi:Lrp/AsnC family transcriptional regulator [Candidatus Woesearchaeota archaeon]|nr:Lrp/AsnC family transcriptional regulator [Candidatus Woesearchaeota archaeon]
MKQNNELSIQNNVKLDLKDKKILLELDFNARMPYSLLAKKVGLSKQGAEYKVNNLIKKGVISGFYPVINVPKLGYKYCRLLVTLQNMSKEKQQEIIDYLLKHHKVFWLFKMHGIYDFLIVIWVKGLSEFREFKEEMENKFEGYIKRAVENIMTDVVHYQHRYLLGVKDTQEIHLKEVADLIKIDELDKRTIDVLSENARLPLVEIAEKVHESAKVVGNRIKRLEQKKIIEGYRPIINHAKIGYTYYKLFIELDKKVKEEVKKLKVYIKNNPLVIYLVEGIALPSDLEIEIMVKSNQQLFEFIEDLRFKFPTLIGEYQTVIFVETLKVKYLPF